MSNSITIVCPTTGRPTLVRALESIRTQGLRPDDVVLLVHDGPRCDDFVFDAWKRSGLPGELIYLEDGPSNDWGHTPRNRVLPTIKSGYVMSIDDDDCLVPFAVDTVRKAINESPEAFFLFRIIHPNGHCVWSDQQVKPGNVGTALFVHPAGIPFGTYNNHVYGDFDFVQRTLLLNPDRPIVWRKEITYLVRPDYESTPANNFRDLAIHSGEQGREDCQAGWQEFFGNRFANRSILDVGAGLALSVPRLSVNGNIVTTLDPGPGLPVDLTGDVLALPSQAWEVVTSFDVIEHIPDALSWLREIVRIAREFVVITTPNLVVWKCQNPHHVREFSPSHLLDMIHQIRELDGKLWSFELFASENNDGRDPVKLNPIEFMATELPVLGVVINKTDKELIRYMPKTPLSPSVGKWNQWYADNPQQRPYDDECMYYAGAEFLKDCRTIEDWGCGFGWFGKIFGEKFKSSIVRNLDGSKTPFAHNIVDLAEYRSVVDGIFMRGVLEHNRNWQAILRNALSSFTRRMALVVYTPFAETTTLINDHRFPDGGTVPVLSLPRSEILRTISEFQNRPIQIAELSHKTKSDFGCERIFYLERSGE